MNLASLGNMANYSLTSIIPGYTNPQVSKVEVDCDDPTIVYLTTSQLVSANMTSTAGHAVRPDWTEGSFLTEDMVPPILQTARVSENELSLTFNEYLQNVYYSTINTFSVKVNGNVVAIESLRANARRIILTLENIVSVDDIVKVAYVPSNNITKVSELSGNIPHYE